MMYLLIDFESLSSTTLKGRVSSYYASRLHDNALKYLSSHEPQKLVLLPPQKLFWFIYEIISSRSKRKLTMQVFNIPKSPRFFSTIFPISSSPLISSFITLFITPDTASKAFSVKEGKSQKNVIFSLIEDQLTG